eukprot:GSChrysophyteH2.ASY1.ANO1.1712.1 assembled CDS
MADEGDKESSYARVLFIIIGIGYLFPFSALTQPVDYWALLFPDFDVEFPITAIYMWTNLIILAMFVFLGDTSPNYNLRMYAGFIGQFIALIVVPTSYFLHLSETNNSFVVLGATAFAAGVTALIDSCIISLATQYPVSCQEGLQVGIGMSTLIGSVYRIFTKAAFPVTMVVQSSLLYFYSGAATILVCIAAYYFLRNDEGISLLSLRAAKNEDESYQSIPTVNMNENDDEEGSSRRKEVFSKVLFNEFMVFLVFTSTLALWPPLVAEIKSVQFPDLNETEWWSLILLFDFAVLDVIGRFCIAYRGPLTAQNIWIPVFIRVVFLSPIIILLAKGIFFSHDAWSIVFVGLLGFTNGYLGSLSIIFVNECVPDKDKGLAGTLTGFTLNAGLVAGATLAIFLQKVV